MTVEDEDLEGDENRAVCAEEPARGWVGSVVSRVAVDVSPLRESRAFRYTFIGSGVSTIGAQVTQVAVAVQVFRITHSSLDVGLVGVAGLLPLIVLGLYGGAIADAVNRRTLLIATSVASCLISVVLVAQSAAGLHRVWLLYACVALQAGSFAVSSPTRRAILPQIVRRDQIATANTLYMGEFNLALVVGPLVAGVAISVGGFPLAYSVDVATFLVSLATTVIGLPSLPPVTGSPRAGLRSVVEGLAFLRGRNNLLMTFIVDIDAMVFGMPRALFPALAVTHFHGGASTVGYLYAAPGVGALVVAASGGWTSAVRRQGLAVVLAITVWGVSIAAFGFSHVLWLGLLLLAIAGAADAVSAIFRSTILQVAAPTELQGRLSGVFMVVVAGGPRLGDLESGVVAVAVTPTFSAVSGGLACLVGLALAVAVVPSFLRYDARHPTP